MANEQNLKPFTSETGREAQKEAVKARNRNTAERKAFGAYLEELLNEIGGQYNGKPATRKMILMVKWLKYVTDDNADLTEGKEFTAILKEIRDTIGEKPVETHSVDLSAGSEKLDDVFSQIGGEGLVE